MNAIVPISENLHRFFSDKHVSGSFELGRDGYGVTIKTPSLVSCSRRMWGDWGPMFCVDLDVGHRIELTYRCETSGREACYRISPPTIELNSPQSWKDREKWPLVMEFADTARCLRFEIFLDKDGGVDHLVVRPMTAHSQPGALLFREAECAALADGGQ